MGFSIIHLFESIILFLNAFAILNEKRFLEKCKLLLVLVVICLIDGWHIPNLD